METGGLDPKIHSLLSIGAVDFGNPTNQFYAEIGLYGLENDPRALKINGIDLNDWEDRPTLKRVMNEFYYWIRKIKTPILAGHNPSFDRDFCNENFLRVGLGRVFNHRTIDLHSVAFAYLTKNNYNFIPHKLYSDTIYKAIDMPQEPRPHNALNGAIYEAEAFSRLIYGRGLGLL